MFLRIALAALLLFRFDLPGFVRMFVEEGPSVDIAAFAGTERVGARRFIDGEVGFDFVLEPEFPGVGFGRVVLPEAVVSHTQARIVAAFLVDAVGEVACRDFERRAHGFEICGPNPAFCTWRARFGRGYLGAATRPCSAP